MNFHKIISFEKQLQKVNLFHLYHASLDCSRTHENSDQEHHLFSYGEK